MPGILPYTQAFRHSAEGGLAARHTQPSRPFQIFLNYCTPQLQSSGAKFDSLNIGTRPPQLMSLRGIQATVVQRDSAEIQEG